MTKASLTDQIGRRRCQCHCMTDQAGHCTGRWYALLSPFPSGRCSQSGSAAQAAEPEDALFRCHCWCCRLLCPGTTQVTQAGPLLLNPTCTWIGSQAACKTARHRHCIGWRPLRTAQPCCVILFTIQAQCNPVGNGRATASLIMARQNHYLVIRTGPAARQLADTYYVSIMPIDSGMASRFCTQDGPSTHARPY